MLTAFRMLWTHPTWARLAPLLTLLLALVPRLLPAHPLLSPDEDLLLTLRGSWPLHLLGLLLLLPSATSLDARPLPRQRTPRRLALYAARLLSVGGLLALGALLGEGVAHLRSSPTLAPSVAADLLARALVSAGFLLSVYQLFEGALGARVGRVLALLVWLLLPVLSGLIQTRVPLINTLLPDLAGLVLGSGSNPGSWSGTALYAMTYSAALLALDIALVSRRD